MTRRLFAAAVLAFVLVPASGFGAWTLRLHAAASAMSAQAEVARSLLAAHAPVNETFVRAIARPGLHVVVADRTNGRLFDVAGDALREHPLPPMGAPDLPPPPPPRSPLAGFVMQLAHLPPERIGDGATIVTIGPDAHALALFAFGDAAAVLFVCAGCAGALSLRGIVLARRERERLLAHLDERRAAADRYQRFLAETGHELRTPLTIVSGYVDILRGNPQIGGLDERIVEGLRAETARMRDLVEKMLALARMNSPVSVPRLLDVADAARTVVATAQRRFPDRAIAYDADGAGSIVIDDDDFTQALGNLIENAVKYAPESPIAVRCAVRDGRAILSVTDRGPGIAAEEREVIFDRFYRGRDRSGAEGLGLGLAIVKRAADRWQGTIEIDSIPGDTVFTLAFPLADEEPHVALG